MKKQNPLIVNINAEWRIRADDNQWVLDKKTQPKDPTLDGNWSARSYSRSIAALFDRAIELGVREMEGEYGPEAIEPLLTQLSAMRDDVKTALAQLAFKK